MEKLLKNLYLNAMVILQGKFNASLKETTLTGSSFANHLRADKISTLLTIKVKSITLYDVQFSKNLERYRKCPEVFYSVSLQEQRRQKPRFSTGIRAQTVTATPPASEASPEQKKTERKGTAVITGASSGLGLATAKALADTGKWHVIMACRNFLKAEKAARSVGMSKEDYTVLHLDLASLESVKQFVDNFRRTEQPLDVLVCNAAVYQPTAKEPSFTAEGFELSVGTNHLGHFLLSRLLLDDLKKSDYPSKRMIIVGSITGK